MTTAASVKVRSGGGFVSLLDVFFPVGSLYLTYSNTNPSKFLGGSWVLYSSDRYLRGGASNAAVGGTGGSNTISVNQMPQHSHLMQSRNWQNWASNDTGVSNRYCVATGANAGYSRRSRTVGRTRTSSPSRRFRATAIPGAAARTGTWRCRRARTRAILSARRASLGLKARPSTSAEASPITTCRTPYASRCGGALRDLCGAMPL